jgi:DNA-binding transcriptional ArsR family regulator
MPDQVPSKAALLLAAIRAAGQVASPRDTAVTAQAAQAAARAGRALLELRAPADTHPTLRLGWPVGNAPNEEHLAEQLPAPLTRVVTLVWALCVKAAWPDPSVPLYPGQPFAAARIEQACAGLGARTETVSAALGRILPQHGLIVPAGGLLHLGPAVAALPGPVVASLRRGHHRLPEVPAAGHPEPLAQPVRVTPPYDLTPTDLPAPSSEEQVTRSIVTSLEAARGPLAPREVAPLADPEIRARVEQILEGLGRCLIRTSNGTWTTGYPDPVAEALGAAKIGTFTPTERAVLALVLVHTVALPRAQGRHIHPQWNTAQHPVTVTELARNRALTQTAIRQALRTLRAAGMVDTAGPGNYIPGPALQRLSPARIAALWEDLILAGRPGGHLARAIAERRAVQRTAPAPERTQ